MARNHSHSLFSNAINAKTYQEIIDEYLVETADTLFPDGWTLVPDNARPHVAIDTLQHFVENQVDFIDWPASSRDLNPIENICSLMKHKVEKKTRLM